MSRIPTIAEQSTALGYTMPELIGKTARQIRALGFEVPREVDDDRTLAETGGVIDERLVDTSTHGRATGYAWLRPAGAVLS